MKRAVDAARDVATLAFEHRHETESQRRPAAAVVERLVGERLCRLALPPELGGRPATATEILAVYELLAAAEASVPWLAWNNSLVCFFARFMEKGPREALFSEPSHLFAQSTRPCGVAVEAPDGYRVSGRWDLVSGCELAEWLFLTCFVGEGCPEDAAPRETRFCFVHRREAEILDTWHTGGLRGTGSHDVVVRDALVPRDFTVSPAEPTTGTHPIERVVVMPNLVAGLAAQALGVARGALDAVTEIGRTRITPGPAPDLRDRTVAQTGVAFHGAALAAAREHLHARAEVLWEQAREGRPSPAEDRAALYAAALHADDVARIAVDALFALGGTRSLYVDCPLERGHRDLHAMLRHAAAQTPWLADAGRVAFGLEPENPQYWI